MMMDSGSVPVGQHENVDDLWASLRRHTQSRIGLGRVGDSQPTGSVLEFKAAHALARDAVHQPLDVAVLAREVGALGLGEPTVVTSRAASRSEYLRRPDLGRLPSSLSEIGCTQAELGFVLCDGLSPTALMRHAAPLLEQLIAALTGRYSIAPPVIATQGRVALGDHIGQAMGVRTVVVLIGERPGLSVATSVGIYLTHLPRPGLTDAARNCVSNVHPPEGLGYASAAQVIADLVAGARQLGTSGVRLKDGSRSVEVASPTTVADL